MSKRVITKIHFSSNPLGKAVVKKKGIEIWQKWWEEDATGYYKIQKSVSIQNDRERNKRK